MSSPLNNLRLETKRKELLTVIQKIALHMLNETRKRNLRFALPIDNLAVIVVVRKDRNL